MKPHEILALLEEASGTKMYEKKKQNALKTLEKKEAKLQEIDKVGAGIAKRWPGSWGGWGSDVRLTGCLGVA